MGDYEVLELPNFVLQRGGMLPAAELVYKTLGTLSPTRDNVVLVPTWYTGTHNDIETFGRWAHARPSSGQRSSRTWCALRARYRTEAYRALGARDYQEHVAYFWEPFFLRCDANNLLSQLWTWLHGDISDNPVYSGNFEAALGAIKARTIILPVDNDRYFPPADSEYEARHIPGAKCRVISSIWGHMAPMNPQDIPAIDSALHELLAN